MPGKSSSGYYVYVSRARYEVVTLAPFMVEVIR